jgi:hypothetical protein
MKYFVVMHKFCITTTKNLLPVFRLIVGTVCLF